MEFNNTLDPDHDLTQTGSNLLNAGPGGQDEGEEEDPRNGLSGESVRAYAESIGISHLADDAAKELAEEVTFRVQRLVQDAVKFCLHSKRERLLASDIEVALRTQGQECLFGSTPAEHIPFRYASGGGRELHFGEDKEIDLNDMCSNALPKIPTGVTLRAHWLAIDGVQPAIPENPPAQSKDQLQSESVNPLTKLNTKEAKENKLAQVTQSKPTKLKNMETVNVKQLATHELSVEQQLYYKEITEACVGSDEGRRAEALQSLQCDPGLHQMLPRLCTFIAEGVRVNVVQHNLAILIYLMRMVKSMLENQTLYLEKYLHELIPAVITCIVSRQLCTRPEADNHWALRGFASRLMANICKNFNTSTNNIQTRVTRMFSEAMKNEKAPLVSYYGAIAGLQELGPEVVKVFIIPHIKAISQRLDQANSEQLISKSLGAIEKIAAHHIKTILVKSVCPVLKSSRSPPDIVEEYLDEFGSLGAHLHSGVVKLRQPPVVKQQPQQMQVQGIATPTAQAQAQRLFLVGAQGQSAPGTPTTPTATRIIIQQQPQH